MDDDTVQLLLESAAEILGVLPYPVDAYQNVARNDVAFHIVESDDVGISIVVEVLAVDLQNIFVVAKKVTDVPYPLFLFLHHLGDPFFESGIFF